jgi:hypothetical protein
MKLLIIAALLGALPVLGLESTPAPTFSNDVAPIIWANCSGCHHAGEVAPFSLTSYADAKRHAKQIARITHDRVMPPWKAEPGYGDFQGERRLTDAQLATIKAWADAGAPEGDAAATPPLPKFTDGWQLGQPDLVLTLAEPYTLRAERPDVFRCFVIPFEIPAGKYIQSVEFRPQNRKVTHHALLFLDGSGQARKLDAADPGPGYSRAGGVGFLPSGGLGGWAPGAPPHRFPDGAAKRIAKGTDLVAQIHFHPSGKIETEQSTIGIYLTDKAPTRAVATLPLGVGRGQGAHAQIDIAPGDKDFKWVDSITLPVAVEVPGISPHAHYLCRDMKVWATPPGGEKQWLIWIKDWDFDWQGQYLYKRPMKFPAGTRFDMEYTYDNSADNPRNPSTPPQRVRRGEQTTDEMGITFIQVVPDKPADVATIRAAMRDHFLGLDGAGGGGQKIGALLERFRNGRGGRATTQPAK